MKFLVVIRHPRTGSMVSTFTLLAPDKIQATQMTRVLRTRGKFTGPFDVYHKSSMYLGQSGQRRAK